MQEIIIDRFLLPALDEETFRLLEENILEHGCRVPLVLWNNSNRRLSQAKNKTSE